MVSVSKLWPGSTIVCIASGPSLTAEDCAFVRGRARVIAINTSYQRAPWADVLYASDAKWWQEHRGAPDFTGLKYAFDSDAAKWPGVQVLQNRGAEGLELSPDGLRHGNNSGYQALGLAFHLGARRIVLLGYDMQVGPSGQRNWHAPHAIMMDSNYEKFRRRFETIVEPLKQAGVTVINCTRRTALTCFPCQPIETAIAAAEVAA